MGEHGGQGQHPESLIDRSGLHDGDLVLAERLADDLEPAGEGRVAKAARRLSGSPACNGGGERFFWVDEVRLCLGERRGKGCERLTGSLHGRPPYRRNRSSPRPISSALPARHARSPPWHPPASAF